MATIALITFAVILTIAIVVLAICLPFFLKWLAEADTIEAKGKVVFTTLQEGTVKTVMRGGGFDHFLMKYKGHHINEPGRPWHDSKTPDHEVVPNDPDKDDAYYDTRFPLFQWLGIYYVGIPGLARSIYIYSFQWKELRKNVQPGEDRVWPRDQATDFIYVKDFPYAVEMKDVKTSELLPVDAIAMVTTRTTNPYKSLFKTEDWLVQVTAAVTRKGRDFIGARTFKALKSEMGVTDGKIDEKNNFSKPIVDLTTCLPDANSDDGAETIGLSEKYGQSVQTADLLDLDLTGAAKAKHEEETLIGYLATQNAEATVKGAEANATAIELEGKANSDVVLMMGNAEAQSLEARLAIIDKHGQTGALLAQLDAMQANGPGKTVIWANNPLIQQPGLTPLLDSLGITPDQLRKLITDNTSTGKEAA